MMPTRPDVPRRRLLTALAASGLLAACGTAPDPAQRVRERQRQQAGQLQRAGYRGDEPPRALAEQHLTLRPDGEPLELLLLQPQGGAALPWVLYLPGLGEGPEGGAVWRRAWAQAGHAVLSVQALTEDEQAWRSELARAAEFARLGRERHAPAVLAQRLARLKALLATLHGPAGVGHGVLAGLRRGGHALAGFDLGASTAWALANETDVPAPAALVLLSPSLAEAQRQEPAWRWPRQPLLLAAGSLDQDPMEWAQPAARLPDWFAAAPRPGQHLLMLDGARHAQLSGSLPPAGLQTARSTLPMATPESGVGRGRSGRGAGGTQEGNPRRLPSAARLPVAEAYGTESYQTALRACSLALLDAELRGQAAARDWLAREAPGWLGAMGELRGG